MGREFSATFAVRYDECNAAGLLRASVYLSYTQEIATLDARDFGHSPHPWVIRRTRLYQHQPVRYPTRLLVRTWGMGFNRSTAQRAYSFTDMESGKLVAEAHSLWVYLDKESLRPARLPDDFPNPWFPEGNAPLPSDLPAWPPLPESEPFLSGLLAGYNLMDGQSHVNNARYLDILEDAAWQASDNEVAAYASLYDIEYYQPAVVGDDLTIATWLHEDERQQEIRRSGQVLARSQSSWQQLTAAQPSAEVEE